MKYSYFPGCAMHATAVEYFKSMKFVNKAIGLEFIDIKDWNCCGATAGHTISHELGLAMPARNVALSQQQQPGMPIIVSCAACYSRLKYTADEINNGDREKLSRLIEMPLGDKVEIVTLMEAYSEPAAMEAIQAAIKKPLEGLKVACYYGCLYTRAPKVTWAENSEDPQLLDKVVSLAGVSTVDWSFKTECCGAGRHVDLPKESKPLIYRILKNARANGAEAIVTACPLCMMNLDMRQQDINMVYGEDFNLPVYFFTELLALAMGASFRKSGVTTHFYPAKKLLKNVLKKASSKKEVV